jgi:hypothetical protein
MKSIPEKVNMIAFYDGATADETGGAFSGGLR